MPPDQPILNLQTRDGIEVTVLGDDSTVSQGRCRKVAEFVRISILALALPRNSHEFRYNGGSSRMRPFGSNLAILSCGGHIKRPEMLSSFLNVSNAWNSVSDIKGLRSSNHRNQFLISSSLFGQRVPSRHSPAPTPEAKDTTSTCVPSGQSTGSSSRTEPSLYVPETCIATFQQYATPPNAGKPSTWNN